MARSRAAVAPRCELSAREHPAQGGTCRSQQPLLDTSVDELLTHLGVLLQQDLEDVAAGPRSQDPRPGRTSGRPCRSPLDLALQSTG